MTVAGQAVIVTTRVDTSIEVETSTPLGLVGCAVAVTGQTMVETTMVSVTMEVERVGQSVTVAGQAMTVLVCVEKMVDVVEPRGAVPVEVVVTVVKDPEPVEPEPVPVLVPELVPELELELMLVLVLMPAIVPEEVPAEPVDVPVLVQGPVERVGVLLVEMVERLTR